MNIWILNPYDQTPEQQATRTYEFAKKFVEQGHDVTIFSSSFNHYRLVEEKLSKHDSWKEEMFEGIRIIWIKTFPYKKNDWRRSINMMSHAWGAFWTGISLKGSPDAIIGVSVPIFSGFSAYVLSILKGSRFFFEVRDLWPQTLIDLGVLSEKSPVTWVMKIIEKLLYQKSHKIISVLPYAHEYIVRLGIKQEKIVWIPNGIDLSKYEFVEERSNNENKFTLMYVGRFGNYQGIELIVETAKILDPEYGSKIQFILVGDGPEKKRIEDMVVQYGLKNFTFVGLLPKREVPKLMVKADACIAILKKMDVLKYGINPNKLFDYLAAGRPILFAINSRNNPVAEANAGITIPPGNPRALAEAVIKIVNMSSDERSEMGKNAKKYVAANYDVNILAKKYESILKN